MKVFILGGDGFCGWPASLRFSALGHDVTIIDNLSRRRIDQDLNYTPLCPIANISERLSTWQSVSGQSIKFRDFDLAQDYEPFCTLLQTEQPDVIIHFAEQRSAPYSMRTGPGRRYTINNNITATHNVLCAISEASPDTHLIHLGTIGVYGYGSAGVKLPEGYLRITGYDSDGRTLDDEILYPGKPDSVYHMSKLLDQHMFAFYARAYGLRCTDLHQGIVWGTQTTETAQHPKLVNRFDYDPIYGTVVNRFLVQAASEFPLTVYGTGKQTRAFIHLEDTIRFISTAIQNPPDRGERPTIVNQISETCSIAGLAEKVAILSNTEVQFLENPRKEPEQNDFVVDATTLEHAAAPQFKFDDHLQKEFLFVKSLEQDINSRLFLPN